MTIKPRRRFKAHNYPNATLIKRLMAMVYDSLLVLSLWMLILGLAAYANGGAVQGPWVTSLLFVAAYGFFAFFWCRSGQTLGMLAWRLRVEDNDGYVIDLKQALVRFIGAIIASGFFAIGYIWVLFGNQRLSWHDHWSNTRIVQLPRRTKQQTN